MSKKLQPRFSVVSLELTDFPDESTLLSIDMHHGPKFVEEKLGKR